MTEPTAIEPIEMVPLLNVAEAAARIKLLRRMRRENRFRLRRLRGKPMADLSIIDQVVLHRSAFAAMGGVWYTFLQTTSGQEPPNDDEYDAAAQAMNSNVVFGISSTWYMNNLKGTPYAMLAPYTMNEVHHHLSLLQRFQNRLDNGQQWLTSDERTCYDHVHPHHYRRSEHRRDFMAPAVTEAVWNVHDYMARQLGEHYALTGRCVTPAEYDIMARGIRTKMVGDAYQSSSVNVDRTQYDILGVAPFAYQFSDDGMLQSIERQPIVQADLDIARLDDEARAMYERQNEPPVATGCPIMHAKIAAPATIDGKRNPNNYVTYLLDHTLATMKKAVFAPNVGELDMFWRLSHKDITVVPVGKTDYRPALKARAANTDKLES